MSGRSNVARANIIRQAVREILSAVEANPDRQGLRETPFRVARAFIESWCSGYDKDPAEVLKAFDDGAENYDQIVLQRNIPVWSLCEHHMAPFFGVAHVGYIPTSRIVGLSKLSRLVDVFAKRLQVQERLTQQIGDALWNGLASAEGTVNPAAVGVVLECRHSCMESRGVERAGTTTTTSALFGAFRTDAAARKEFFDLIAR